MLCIVPAFTGLSFLPHRPFSASKRSPNVSAHWLASENSLASSRAFEVSVDGITHNIRYVSSNGSASSTPRRPLFFIHGSYHASWMWENFMRYLGARGYTSYAVDLKSSASSNNGKVVMGDQVKEIDAILRHLQLSHTVVIGHSFGGLLAQRLIRDVDQKWGGLVLLASTPPSGNDAMVWRTVRRDGILRAWKITRGFAFGAVTKDVNLCRELLFRTECDGMKESDNVLKMYMERFAESEGGRLDLKEVKRNLPRKAGQDIAEWVDRIPPTLVIGGSKDVIVDIDGIEETAKFYGVKPVILDNFPHDLPLCNGWETPAALIADWLDRNVTMERSL